MRQKSKKDKLRQKIAESVQKHGPFEEWPEPQTDYERKKAKWKLQIDRMKHGKGGLPKHEWK